MLMKIWNHPLYQVDNDENLEPPIVSSGFVHSVMTIMKTWNHPLYQVDLYIDILAASFLKRPEFVDLYIDILAASILKLS